MWRLRTVPTAIPPNYSDLQADSAVCLEPVRGTAFDRQPDGSSCPGRCPRKKEDGERDVNTGERDIDTPGRDDPSDAPDHPTDEPKPAPVQDPPAEPNPAPSVVRGANGAVQNESRTMSDVKAGERKERRGFASMSPEKQREIASKGGRAAHQKGTAHEWTSEEARSAGRKGGQISRGGRGRLVESTQSPEVAPVEDRGLGDQ